MTIAACVLLLAAGATVIPRFAAQAATTPTIQLLSTSSWGPDTSGAVHIVGEVVDNTNAAADFISVSVGYYDSAGDLLGTGTARPVLGSLNPGQASPFELVFQPPPKYEHYRVISISGQEAGEAADTYFGIRTSNVYTDGKGYTHYVGDLTNENSNNASAILVSLTGYDGNGRTVVVGSARPVTDSGEVVEAGQTVPFDVVLAPGEPRAASYRLAAESLDVPQPTPQDAPVTRIAGSDAIGTAIAISQQSFSNQSAKAVTLARADYFSDALAGGPLAASSQAPLLITPGASQSSTLDTRVAAEIRRVLPQGGTVYILGGIDALSPEIESQLTAMGYKPVRIAGDSAAGTAVAIAQQLGDPSTVFEATGTNFPDALSAVPAAIKTDGAILLTDGPVQDPATSAYLDAHPSDTRYAVGGPAAASGADPSATPIWGYDLSDTSAVIAARFFPTATVFGAATGASYPDALAGGVFMADGGRSGPVILVSPNAPLPPAVSGYLSDSPTVHSGYLFGGTLAVTPAVLTALAQTPATVMPPPGPPPMSWTHEASVDASHGLPSSISCPSATFCVALDGMGNWMTYNGTGWSPPSPLGQTFGQVSCTSSQFCLAMVWDGSIEYNGSTWSAPTPAPQDLTSVSCASPTFCVATGLVPNPSPQPGQPLTLDEASVFNGTSWSTATTLDSFGLQSTVALTAVSCPEVNFCVAADDGGNAFTYTSAGWSAPVPDGLGDSFDPDTPIAVSCGSTTECTAVYGSHAATYNGTTWGQPVVADSGNGGSLDSISCPHTGSCVASDTAGYAVANLGTGWSSPTEVDPGAHPNFGGSYVSCSSPVFCAYVDRFGGAATDDGAMWSPATTIDPRRGGLTSESCPTTSYCVAVDRYGWVTRYNGTTWTVPSLIDPHGQEFPNAELTSVSCPTTAFCAASDSFGNVLTFNGSSWSAPAHVSAPGDGLQALSCTSSSFCVGLGDSYAFEFDGLTWSSTYLGGGAWTTISCATATYCLAADNEGNADTYNGSTWTPTSKPPGVVTSVSCPSTTFCGATTGSDVTSFSGSAWTTAVSTETISATVLGVACASSAYCSAILTDGYVEGFDQNGVGTPENLDAPTEDLTAISCPSTMSCIALDGAGEAFYGTK